MTTRVVAGMDDDVAYGVWVCCAFMLNFFRKVEVRESFSDAEVSEYYS